MHHLPLPFSVTHTSCYATCVIIAGFYLYNFDKFPLGHNVMESTSHDDSLERGNKRFCELLQIILIRCTNHIALQEIGLLLEKAFCSIVRHYVSQLLCESSRAFTLYPSLLPLRTACVSRITAALGDVTETGYLIDLYCTLAPSVEFISKRSGARESQDVKSLPGCWSWGGRREREGGGWSLALPISDTPGVGQ